MTSRTITDETTIISSHNSGILWYTTNLGRPWTEPEEDILAGRMGGITIKGDVHLVSGGATTYVSLDAGKTYLARLGQTDCPNNTSGGTKVFDANFTKNGYVYNHPNIGTGLGVWRVKLDMDDPEKNEWEQIDAASAGAGSTVGPRGPAFTFGGVLTIFDSANVSAGDLSGGIWRCTNPAADINSIYPPMFHKENNGLLGDGAAIALDDSIEFLTLGVGRPGVTWYLKNVRHRDDPANYELQLLNFTDTMYKPASPLLPENKAVNAGVSLSTTDLRMAAVLSWAAVPGATSYQYQISRDPDFSAVFAQAYSTGNEVTVQNHIAGETYYWRVRVAQEATNAQVTAGLANAAGDAIGAPLVTPWSAGPVITSRGRTIGQEPNRSYTMGSSVAVEFKAVSPEIGALGVSVQPTFVWTGLEGALSYEIVVAENPDFAIPEWSHTADQTFYKPEETLRYDTTYYWRVRGILVESAILGSGRGAKVVPAVGGPWATGVITTMAEPSDSDQQVIVVPEAAPPPEVKVVEVPIPAPAPPIPTPLLWAIVVIGAALIIALIVLIVRTRRVA